MRDQHFLSRLGLDRPLTSLALCWRLVRCDGVILGFTSHDRDLYFSGLLFRALSGMTPSALDSAAIDKGAAGEIAGYLSDGALRADDLQAGRYMGARAELWLVDWQKPETSAVLIARNWVESVLYNQGRFEARLSALQKNLDAQVGQKLTPSCTAFFGDTRCKAHSALYTRDAKLQQVEDDWTVLVDKPDTSVQYSDGIMRLCVGFSAGLDFHILQSADVQGAGLRLWLDRALPADVTAGMRVRLYAGCDRRFETCRDIYHNHENFRGAPHVPGMDSLLAYPGL